MYEIFDHTADLGLRVRATDLPALFADAAAGLFSMLVEDLTSVQPRVSITVHLQNADRSYLLFDWLNELLYRCDTDHLAFSKFEVKIDGDVLSAVAAGEPLDPERHRIAHEIKAITYHELKVERDGNGWLAEVIVDI